MPWKLYIPAALSGLFEHLTFDHVHNAPRYGVRTELMVALLRWWIARERGEELPHVPSLAELLVRRTQG